MAKRSKSPRGGLTPGKGIAIGILAVVLLLVIVSQFSGKKKTVAVEPRSRRTAAEISESTSSATPPGTSPAAKRSEQRWPTFNVAAVVASNPFVQPEALLTGSETAKTLTATSEPGEDELSLAAIESANVREMRRRQAEFMTSLRTKGVDMILRSRRGSIARIGDLSLRVGDVHEGLRVVEIGQNGVVFAPFLAEDVQPE
ncbi:MAG: hypothetical protein HYV60_06115 [Planctomycetia bacterium]|nr:hypothetical protein [Planctomycetia bacterium]